LRSCSGGTSERGGGCARTGGGGAFRKAGGGGLRAVNGGEAPRTGGGGAGAGAWENADDGTMAGGSSPSAYLSMMPADPVRCRNTLVAVVSYS